jgi:hypothetical protein
MNTIEYKVGDTMTTVIRGYHRLAKSVMNTQERMDKILDAVLDFSKKTEQRTREIKVINELIQKLTWLTNPPDAEDMEAIEIIIASCTQLLSDILFKEKEFLESSELIKHLPTVITSYLEEVENLEENVHDLHEIFFVLPQNEEFQKLNHSLAGC